MKKPFFTVWFDPKPFGWRFTLWSANGSQLAESLTAYATKANAKRGCESVMLCFSEFATLEILDAA